MNRIQVTTAANVRKVDPLGRVTLPKHYRNMLGLQPEDKVSLSLYSQGIVLSKWGGESSDVNVPLPMENPLFQTILQQLSSLDADLLETFSKQLEMVYRARVLEK